MDNGWIKIHRKFLKWEWFKNANMAHLFLYLLLRANKQDLLWQKTVIKRGQLVTGLKKLHINTGISIQSLRTCLTKLSSTSELTIKSTNRFTIITVVKYEDYQSAPSKSTSKSTSKLTNNQQQTIKILQEDREVKERSRDICPFEIAWNQYPKRLGRKAAQRHYLANIKTPADHEALLKAIGNYKAYLKENNTEEQYIKHGSSFFNQYRDWIDYQPKANTYKPKFCIIHPAVGLVDGQCSRCRSEREDASEEAQLP